jgi:hypothetical protein
LKKEEGHELTNPKEFKLSTDLRARTENFKNKIEDEIKKDSENRKFKARRLPNYEKNKFVVQPSDRPITTGICPLLNVGVRSEIRS